MLRITTHENAESLTFQLEGKLAGPWVKELQNCWHNCEIRESTRAVWFDLTGLTFIDSAGKEVAGNSLSPTGHAHGDRVFDEGGCRRDHSRSNKIKSSYRPLEPV